MIQRLKIENFKSLDKIEIRLLPFTVLLGPNGAGKTSILQAISCLKGMMSDNFDRWLQERGTKFDDLPSLTGNNKRVTWELDIDLADPKAKYQTIRYTLVVRAWRYVGVETEEVKVLENGKPSSILLSRNKRKVELRDEVKDSLNEPKEVFAQASSILATLDYENDAENYSTLLALRGFFEKIAVHKVFDVEGMRFARQSVEQDLSPSGDNLQGNLAWMKSHDAPGFERTTRSIKELFPNVQEIDVKPGPWGGRMTHFSERLSRKPGDTVNFRGSQASDGFLRLLALAALTQRSVHPSFLGLEEIENGVHLSLVKQQLDLLDGIATSKPGCQVVVTTHNSFLLDFLDPKVVRVIQRKGGKTRVDEIPANNPYLATRALHPGELWEFKEEKGLLETPRQQKRTE